MGMRHDSNILYGAPSSKWNGTESDELIWVCQDGIEMKTSTMKPTQIDTVAQAMDRKMTKAINTVHKVLQKNNMTVATPAPDTYMDEDDAKVYRENKLIISINRPIMQRILALVEIQSRR